MIIFSKFFPKLLSKLIGVQLLGLFFGLLGLHMAFTSAFLKKFGKLLSFMQLLESITSSFRTLTGSLFRGKLGTLSNPGDFKT